jgi:hypothetical protein
MAPFALSWPRDRPLPHERRRLLHQVSGTCLKSSGSSPGPRLAVRFLSTGPYAETAETGRKGLGMPNEVGPPGTDMLHAGFARDALLYVRQGRSGVGRSRLGLLNFGRCFNVLTEVFHSDRAAASRAPIAPSSGGDHLTMVTAPGPKRSGSVRPDTRHHGSLFRSASGSQNLLEFPGVL